VVNVSGHIAGKDGRISAGGHVFTPDLAKARADRGKRRLACGRFGPLSTNSARCLRPAISALESPAVVDGAAWNDCAKRQRDTSLSLVLVIDSSICPAGLAGPNT